MKPVNAFLSIALALLPYHLQASETDTDYIPLNYNSPGLNTQAQTTLLEKDAEFVENEYQDLDQDGVLDKIDLCPNTILGVKVDSHGCELDSDQDGVFDRLDQCPGTAPGVKVNIFGCEGDEDGDGVFDSKDQCPGTPAGTPVDEVGCKLIGDADKDGVNDGDDQCPNTPEGATVNQYGCEPVSFVLTNINFDTAKHNIREDQAKILKSDAASLQNLQADEVILITGHTDWQSSTEYNLRLSWRRANSTKAFIVKEFGLNPDDVYIDGKGESQPIADNTTAEGLFKNRRIEFKIMKRDELPAEAKLKMPAEMAAY